MPYRLEDHVETLPSEPGVYLMKGANDEIIYVVFRTSFWICKNEQSFFSE